MGRAVTPLLVAASLLVPVPGALASVASCTGGRFFVDYTAGIDETDFSILVVEFTARPEDRAGDTGTAEISREIPKSTGEANHNGA